MDDERGIAMFLRSEICLLFEMLFPLFSLLALRGICACMKSHHF